MIALATIIIFTMINTNQLTHYCSDNIHIFYIEVLTSWPMISLATVIFFYKGILTNWPMIALATITFLTMRDAN